MTSFHAMITLREMPGAGGEGKLFNLITFKTGDRVVVSGPACEAAYRQKLGFFVQTRDEIRSGNITGPCVLESRFFEMLERFEIAWRARKGMHYFQVWGN